MNSSVYLFDHLIARIIRMSCNCRSDSLSNDRNFNFRYPFVHYFYASYFQDDGNNIGGVMVSLLDNFKRDSKFMENEIWAINIVGVDRLPSMSIVVNMKEFSNTTSIFFIYVPPFHRTTDFGCLLGSIFFFNVFSISPLYMCKTALADNSNIIVIRTKDAFIGGLRISRNMGQ